MGKVIFIMSISIGIIRIVFRLLIGVRSLPLKESPKKRRGGRIRETSLRMQKESLLLTPIRLKKTLLWGHLININLYQISPHPSSSPSPTNSHPIPRNPSSSPPTPKSPPLNTSFPPNSPSSSKIPLSTPPPPPKK